MKKKILLAVTAATMMASVASASPLTDYSTGKAAIDLTWRNTEITRKVEGDRNVQMGEKNNMDWSITAGLGNNLAVQYRQFDPKSKATALIDPDDGPYVETFELKTQEANLLYKVNETVSAYVGAMKVKGVVSDEGSESVKLKDTTILQVGLVGTTKINDSTTAYASVSAGKDLTTFEIGIGQEIAPNLELNVNYREIQVNKLEADMTPVVKVDAKAKGVGFGVSYKF